MQLLAAKMQFKPELRSSAAVSHAENDGLNRGGIPRGTGKGPVSVGNPGVLWATLSWWDRRRLLEWLMQ